MGPLPSLEGSGRASRHDKYDKRDTPRDDLHVIQHTRSAGAAAAG